MPLLLLFRVRASRRSIFPNALNRERRLFGGRFVPAVIKNYGRVVRWLVGQRTFVHVSTFLTILLINVQRSKKRN